MFGAGMKCCAHGRRQNVVAESFFATLKTELVHRHRWKTRVELAGAIHYYIDLAQ
ncbi:MAG TPA: IS3 family transposase [Solirubrobacteraceae bacterium]|jgi:hypothetical protein